MIKGGGDQKNAVLLHLIFGFESYNLPNGYLTILLECNKCWSAPNDLFFIQEVSALPLHFVFSSDSLEGTTFLHTVHQLANRHSGDG